MFIRLCIFQRQRLVAVDLSKQKDADPRAIQQIVFQGVVGGDDDMKIRLYTILEKVKRNSIRILQRNSKGFVRIYKCLNTIQ